MGRISKLVYALDNNFTYDSKSEMIEKATPNTSNAVNACLNSCLHPRENESSSSAMATRDLLSCMISGVAVVTGIQGGRGQSLRRA
jgi:hypothetical protein